MTYRSADKHVETWTETHSQQFNIWGAEMLLLSDVSRIKLSVMSLSAVSVCPYSLIAE